MEAEIEPRAGHALQETLGKLDGLEGKRVVHPVWFSAAEPRDLRTRKHIQETLLSEFLELEAPRALLPGLPS